MESARLTPGRHLRVASWLSVPVCQLATWAVLSTLLWPIGCGPPAARSRPGRASKSSTPQDQGLVPALELLAQLDRISQERASADLVYLLNRWHQGQPAETGWKYDELADRLPRDIRDLLPLDMLPRPTFDLHDTRVLLEAAWARDVSLWVTRQAPPSDLTSWLAERQPPLDREAREQLQLAERLFDWTVRNIQLDPLLPYSAEAVGAAAQEAADKSPAGNPAAGRSLPPYARGVPGPGYQHEAWQTLLMGHGDAWERLRVFNLLARQQQLDTAVLAIFDVNVSPRPQAWVAAVLVGEELFLFDPALGLPLPAAEGRGIATLSELRAHPEWLAALDIDAETRYPVQGKDLANVVALIDATPAALSLRMQHLEKQLAGEHRMIITSRPSPLADRLRKSPGIGSVNLWTVPWEAELFTAALAHFARSGPPPELQSRLAEEALFASESPFVQGRYRHLHGAFTNTDDALGAKGYYLQSRFPDDVIDRLGVDERAQRAVGLVRDRYESDNSWNNKLRLTQIITRTAKTHSSFWLGLVHYENGQYDVAADWLKARTLEAPGNSPWKSGARYNLARCYEQLGKVAEARELYQEDHSPQRHGSLLRARRLRSAP